MTATTRRALVRVQHAARRLVGAISALQPNDVAGRAAPRLVAPQDRSRQAEEPAAIQARADARLGGRLPH